MKKIVLFFCVVAMVATTFISTSCNKNDDDNEKEPDGIIEVVDDLLMSPGATRAEFPLGKVFWGYQFDVKWTKAKYQDYEFEYELYYSEIEYESDKSKIHSFGIQKDTICHILFDPKDIVAGKTYYLTLKTYELTTHKECGFPQYSTFAIPTDEEIKKGLTILADNNIFNCDAILPRDTKKLNITLFDIDGNNQVVKKYDNVDFHVETLTDKMTLWANIPEGWTGYYSIQFVDTDGCMRYELFDKVD